MLDHIEAGDAIERLSSEGEMGTLEGRADDPKSPLVGEYQSRSGNVCTNGERASRGPSQECPVSASHVKEPAHRRNVRNRVLFPAISRCSLLFQLEAPQILVAVAG